MVAPSRTILPDLDQCGGSGSFKIVADLPTFVDGEGIVRSSLLINYPARQLSETDVFWTANPLTTYSGYFSKDGKDTILRPFE